MYLQDKPTLPMAVLASVLAISTTARANETAVPTVTISTQKPTLCQAQVILPAAYADSVQKVQIYEASTSYTIQPTGLGHGEKRVKVADGYIEYEVIPAQFKEVTATIEVERERVELEVIPPIYRTEMKKVKLKDGTTRWNPKCPPMLAGEKAEAVPERCLIKVPAEYKEMEVQVLERPARTIKKVIPARTQEVTRKIKTSPAKLLRKEIPPVYETVELVKVETPARVLSNHNKAKHVEMPVSREIRPIRYQYRPSLCENSLSVDDIKMLQSRLQRHGHYQGTIDGILSTQTRKAITQYQEAKNLASGAITLETVKSLQLR